MRQHHLAAMTVWYRLMTIGAFERLIQHMHDVLISQQRSAEMQMLSGSLGLIFLNHIPRIGQDCEQLFWAKRSWYPSVLYYSSPDEYSKFVHPRKLTKHYAGNEGLPHLLSYRKKKRPPCVDNSVSDSIDVSTINWPVG